MGTSRMMNRHCHDNAHVVKKIRTTVSTDKLESGVKLAQMLKGVSPCCFEYPVWLQARFAPVFVFGAAAVAWILSKCFDLNTLMCILLSGLAAIIVRIVLIVSFRSKVNEFKRTTPAEWARKLQGITSCAGDKGGAEIHTGSRPVTRDIRHAIAWQTEDGKVEIDMKRVNAKNFKSNFDWPEISVPSMWNKVATFSALVFVVVAVITSVVSVWIVVVLFVLAVLVVIASAGFMWHKQRQPINEDGYARLQDGFDDLDLASGAYSGSSSSGALSDQAMV